MSESPALRFLYHTAPGRCLLKLLVQPGVSRLAGSFLDSRPSRLLISPFQKRNGITLEGITVPQGGFPSFNAFFCRRRQEITFDPTPSHLISPCDGFLSVFPVDKSSVFTIKHTRYSLNALLRDDALAKEFSGGTALIFRLTPKHYHRYIFVDEGEIAAEKDIPGVLHTVRPIALEAGPVYIQNSRKYVLFHSEHFSDLIQMEVGALLVGRITNPQVSGPIVRGMEKGYFEFGGSTILLLLKKDQMALNPQLWDALRQAEEVPVTLGQWIGTKQ